MSRKTRLLIGLGSWARAWGIRGAALWLFEAAVRACRDERDELRLAHTIRHVGDIHRDARRLDLAEPRYREALAIYRRHGEAPPLDLANALRPLAILMEQTGHPDEAVDLWKEARDLYATVDVRPGVTESQAHLVKLGAR